MEAEVKSEPAPADNSGPVRVIVRDSVEAEVLNTDNDVMLEAYAPWCGHCKSLAPTYEKLGSIFKKEPRVTVAKVDATANDLPKSWGVVDWVSGNSSPILAELDESNQDYYEAFFESKLPKVIAFFESTPSSDDLADLKAQAKVNIGTHMFTWIEAGKFQGAVEYFGVDASKLPSLVLHNSETDEKYKSKGANAHKQPALSEFITAAKVLQLV